MGDCAAGNTGEKRATIMGIAAEMAAKQAAEAPPPPAADSSQGASASPADNSGVGHPDFAPPPKTSQQAPAESQGSDLHEPKTVPYAVAKAEREKRQKIELEHQRALGELEVLRRQGPSRIEPEKPAALSKAELEAQLWQDPVGFQEARTREILRAERAQEWQERLSDDVAEMRDEHEDYDEMEGVFAQQAKLDPTMNRRLLRQTRPAEYAYRWAKRFVEKQQTGGAKEKALTAKIQELESRLKEQETIDSATQVPHSNAGATGAGVSAAEPRAQTGVDAALYSKHRRKSY